MSILDKTQLSLLGIKRSPKSKPLPREEDFKDLGLGTNAINPNQRLLNSDGSFNLKRTGLSFKERFHFYQNLLTISWSKFNTYILLFYIIENFIFATLYYIIGHENLRGAEGITLIEKYRDCFFFSVQTITTVGYGHLAPSGWWMNIIAAIESLLGLLVFAIITGLLYARFSRPNVKLLTSKNCLISPYRDITALIFRIANARHSQLIEAEVQAFMSYNKFDENGNITRGFDNLKLERHMINMLALSWNIVHPIDEDSPFFSKEIEDFKNSSMEILVLFKSYDETINQQVHYKFSYTYEQIVIGAKFAKMFRNEPEGYVNLMLDKLDEYETAELPKSTENNQ
ncbi:MAG: transporter [Bacteroidetes bacterium]|nr:transporter [Bacteroidota bacterium]